MALRELIVSPPGTGKTAHCIELFKEAILRSKAGIDSRAYFILPSREHAERIQNLVLKKDVPGLFNAHILTIDDFASRVLGIRAGTRPNDAIRRSILDHILDDPAVEWSVFSSVKDLAGFRKLLLDMLKEFKSNLFTAEAFEKRAAPFLRDSLQAPKYRDILFILKRYEEELAARGLVEYAEDFSDKMIRLAGQTPELVIFDGFYAFARAQRFFLKAVASWARRTVVTLTISDGTRPMLFEYPERTRRFLVAIGFREKKNSFTENRRTKEPALIHFEKNLFSDKPSVFRGRGPLPLQILEAPDARAEIQMIAREIKKLYRERALHYSDIAVIFRSVSGFEKILRTVFEGYDIPVSIHERLRLVEHGFSHTLCRFLNLALENWKREDLEHLFGSNYFSPRVTLAGVRAFKETAWCLAAREGRENFAAMKDHETLSADAKAFLSFLLESEAALLGSATIDAALANLRRFVGQMALLAEDGAVLDQIETLFENLRFRFRSSKEQSFSLLGFLRELRSSLEASLFSAKSTDRNRVQIYDVVMALPKEYKVVFMAGLVEKGFPAEITEDALFKDAERKVLNGKDPILDERLWRRSSERYFFYMGVTRAKELVRLSYSRYEAGRPLLASFFIDEVKACFLPGVIETARQPMGASVDILEAESESEWTGGLLKELFSGTKSRPVIAALWNEAIKHEAFCRAIRIGTRPCQARIADPAALEALRAADKPFSPTRLEIYATCAFRYFAGEVLSLREPLEDRRPIEMGNLLHKTLEAFYKNLTAEERKTGSFLERPERAARRLEETLDDEWKKGAFFSHEPLYRKRYYREELLATLRRFLGQEKKFLSDGALVPAFFELDFGKKGSRVGALEIPSEEGPIAIRGQIDRLDLTPDNRSALVTDYKRSEREWTLEKRLRRGIEIQLPVYLLAVKKLLGYELLGAQLRFLRRGKSERLAADESLGRLLEETEERIRALVKRLRSGDIAVRSKTCKHCPFDAVCRFEKWKVVYTHG